MASAVCSTSYSTPSPRCPVSFSLLLPPSPPAALLRLAPFPISSLRRTLAISPPTPRVAALETLTLDDGGDEDEEEEEEEEAGLFSGEACAAGRETMRSPELEVLELEELPEQWRRSRIAWLCKELPAYKQSTLTRILNAQRKWLTQDDATYVVVHCLRIRENQAAFRVHTWMSRQHWYRFNFALATRLADFLGRDGKVAKCREVFDSMIKQGRVPSESTFHILTVAYLSSTTDGSIEEACTIYNQMIQMGGYRPRLSLHNSLFHALVSKTGGTSKHNIRQAEFVYHNIVTSHLDVHKDVYAGLIWLHSYQDIIDRDRIMALRKEMKRAGFEETESKDVLVSVMRAFAKEGDVDETEAAWLKLLQSGCELPAQAFVCRMELYSRIGEPMKSLDILKEMKEQNIPPNVATYLKIIEVMTKAREINIAEQLMDEFNGSHMKHLMPAFLNLMYMYLDLGMHENLELTFSKCLARCRPNRILYIIYLESLVRVGNIEKAEEVFGEMHTNGMIGTNGKSCNIILRGYLSAGEYLKAEKIHDMMHQKKYDIDPESLEKLQSGLILNKKVVKKAVAVTMKLDQEQREILIGMLLGGIQIESDEQRRNHIVHFKFRENSEAHSALRAHIHERFFEWLTSASRSINDENEIPYQFSTIAHSHFGFFADQFYLKGRPVLPKLVHRWLSPRVLAYWFMFGGFRLSSGDIVLKLNGGSSEGVEKIARSLRAQSLASKVKRKGRFFWIGFQGSNADSFWKLIEPYVLKDVKGSSTPQSGSTESDSAQFGDTDTESDGDEQRYNVEGGKENVL